LHAFFVASSSETRSGSNEEAASSNKRYERRCRDFASRIHI